MCWGGVLPEHLPERKKVLGLPRRPVPSPSCPPATLQRQQRGHIFREALRQQHITAARAAAVAAANLADAPQTRALLAHAVPTPLPGNRINPGWRSGPPVLDGVGALVPTCLSSVSSVQNTADTYWADSDKLESEPPRRPLPRARGGHLPPGPCSSRAPRPLRRLRSLESILRKSWAFFSNLSLIVQHPFSGPPTRNKPHFSELRRGTLGVCAISKGEDDGLSPGTELAAR